MSGPATNVARRVVAASGAVDPNYTAEETIDPTTGGLNVNVAGGALAIASELATSLNGIADQNATGTAVALGSLAAGPNGILVTSHPNNDPASVIRVATNAATNIGVPLARGGSWTFNVANASALKIIYEASVTGGVAVSVMQA